MDTITAYKAKTKSGNYVYIPEVTKVASNILNNEEQIDLVDSSVQTSLKSLENRLNTAELDSASINGIQEAIDAIQEMAYAAKVETDFNAMDIDMESPEMTAYIDSLTGITDPGGELDDYLTANVEVFPEKIDELDTEIDELLAQLKTELDEIDGPEISEDDDNETFGSRKSLKRKDGEDSSEQTYNSATEAANAVLEEIQKKRTEASNKAKNAKSHIKSKIDSYKTQLKSGKTYGKKFKNLLTETEKKLNEFKAIIDDCSKRPDDEKPLNGDTDPEKNKCCKALEDAGKEIAKIEEFKKNIPTNDDSELKAAFDCGFACGFDNNQAEPTFSGIEENAKRIGSALNDVNERFSIKEKAVREQAKTLKNLKGSLSITYKKQKHTFPPSQYTEGLALWVNSFKDMLDGMLTRFNNIIDGIVTSVLNSLKGLFKSTCDTTPAENKVQSIYNEIRYLHPQCHTDGITLVYHLEPPCEIDKNDRTSELLVTGSQFKKAKTSPNSDPKLFYMSGEPDGRSEENYNKWGYWTTPENTDGKRIDIYGKWEYGRWYQIKENGTAQDPKFIGYVWVDNYWSSEMDDAINAIIENKKAQGWQFLGRKNESDNPHSRNALAVLSFQTPKIKVTHRLKGETIDSNEYVAGETADPFEGATLLGGGPTAVKNVSDYCSQSSLYSHYVTPFSAEDISKDEETEVFVEVEETRLVTIIHRTDYFTEIGSDGGVSNEYHSSVNAPIAERVIIKDDTNIDGLAKSAAENLQKEFNENDAYKGWALQDDLASLLRTALSESGVQYIDLHWKKDNSENVVGLEPNSGAFTGTSDDGTQGTLAGKMLGFSPTLNDIEIKGVNGKKLVFTKYSEPVNAYLNPFTVVFVQNYVLDLIKSSLNPNISDFPIFGSSDNKEIISGSLQVKFTDLANEWVNWQKKNRGNSIDDLDFLVRKFLYWKLSLTLKDDSDDSGPSDESSSSSGNPIIIRYFKDTGDSTPIKTEYLEPGDIPNPPEMEDINIGGITYSCIGWRNMEDESVVDLSLPVEDDIDVYADYDVKQ